MITEINESELCSLLELYTELGDNTIPNMDESLNSIWESIVSNKNYHIVVAKENNKIVSTCTVNIIPNLTHNQRPYAFIENVVTSKEYRKKGYGTAVLNYAKDIAIKENCYKIMLLTGSKRESTLNFYKKVGYNCNDKTAFIMWL
ncbi:GNAT family N-acetyltransferase [Clostridium bornimense]|uniref:GNAT family N-acetyltransferase n=1 Tax=Clostridium bornimense TaxID=1216932 RepID=UPI001C1183F8|nr:GNAT family N-acetyltransferase [Clostridium bornimense]MBU5314865.1 GNAT family N-acetyltransferase [Clostridium bornimense]